MKRAVFILFSFTVLLTGCSTSAISPSSMEDSLPKDRTLVTRTVSGGHCTYGECSSVLTVQADGTWVREEAGSILEGNVEPSYVDALLAAIPRTRILQASPFTGECPSAYDGTVIQYEWTDYDADGEAEKHSASTCEYVVSARDPLVKAVDAIAVEAYKDRELQ